ncbi:uncharacterized protein Z518_00788 [Rhinocladiella mackenziei CBS 650.93]|uniref:DNA topoisomerase (ATP-hydrolyzing) n=1 Tax=Rhinocladiella mackenziei CBS 650.93 TaxID=1442369 RepID=A0A0D2G4Q7_9EURO|nr:uncharacterized protein Z518_00788 [Rhinocladiella mackenziei CBS 650.93]KIX09707.1 hypothetical protein Z518_00788 [Rhinocladiella mackenziei CBS 650.93]
MNLGMPVDDRPSTSRKETISAGNQKVLDYIETTFNGILHEIKVRPCGRPVIVIRRIITMKPYYDPTDFMRLKWHTEDREVKYYFPGKNADESWRFACLGRILGEIHTAIRTGITVTKRDIYYRDPSLFRRQKIVDRYIDDIAYTCQVTRGDMNVTASPKGLMAGLPAPSEAGRPSMIQAACENASITGIQHLQWILVVEKEATFNALVEGRFHQHTTIGPGGVLTAKGYPDLATRKILRLLLNHARPSTQVFGLFDWDPDGIRMLKCYLYGSKNLAQEHNCNTPELKWLGLKVEDVVSFGHPDEPSMLLTTRDRITAISMLASEEWRDGSGAVLPDLRETMAELQRMLMLNRKAEIQILDERKGGLQDWLVRKLGDGSKDITVVS